MIRLILATRNQHKVREIHAILGADAECLGLGAFAGVPELVEAEPTFEGNAASKARQVLAWLSEQRDPRCLVGTAGWAVVADDSGLEVDALGGAPGVLSARFAAEEHGGDGNSPDRANLLKLLHRMRDVPLESRTARFRCVLALARSTGEFSLFQGQCEGRIGLEPRGNGGFGYDPVFVPEGHEVSFAELGEAAKNTLSHRARALAGLREWLRARARKPLEAPDDR